jgi:hypothetical protein
MLLELQQHRRLTNPISTSVCKHGTYIVFEAWRKPTSSPHPPTAIMSFALGNSERMVEMGTFGWKEAVALAMAKAMTT